MANQILTIGQITREALRLFRNQNAFLQNIDTQYDSQFARDGAKIGATLRIRKPVDYVVRNGPTAVPQSTVEGFTSLTISQYQGVDFSFTSSDLALSIDEMAKRYIAPAMNNLCGAIAQNVIQNSELANHFVHNVDGNGNTTSPTVGTFLQAGAYLDNNSAPRGDGKRIAILDPVTQSRVVNNMAGYFNPASVISDQTKTGMMGKNILGFDFMMDQTIMKHQTANYGTLPTVNGAGQSGNVLAVSATTAPINLGDIFTIAGVYGVNRITKQSTGTLRQFTATANVPVGATSIPLDPPITAGLTAPDASGNVQVQYQTVTNSPASGAAIMMVNNANEIYRSNLCFVPEAFTMATADLPLYGKGVVDSHRESYDGISVRVINYYNGQTDVAGWRLDILYGSALLRPEWVVKVGDSL